MGYDQRAVHEPVVAELIYKPKVATENIYRQNHLTEMF